MSDPRRAYERLTLAQPLDGWFGDFAVRLIDVSATGAQIEIDEPIPPDSRALLRFWWRGSEVEITAEIARPDEVRPGLRFVDEAHALRELISLSADELARAYEANAAGNRAANIVGDQTITSASEVVGTGFVMWTLHATGWKSRHTLLSDQPVNGFTIPAGEPEDQVALLRETYESGDADARNLTRMLAELSVGSAVDSN